jgi:hypothetical protein
MALRCAMRVRLIAVLSVVGEAHPNAAPLLTAMPRPAETVKSGAEVILVGTRRN